MWNATAVQRNLGRMPEEANNEHRIFCNFNWRARRSYTVVYVQPNAASTCHFHSITWRLNSELSATMLLYSILNVKNQWLQPGYTVTKHRSTSCRHEIKMLRINFIAGDGNHLGKWCVWGYRLSTRRSAMICSTTSCVCNSSACRKNYHTHKWW